jgi:hypothetical protein
MQELDEILCVPVVYPDRTECFEPLRDYLIAPPYGTWIKRESRRAAAGRV